MTGFDRSAGSLDEEEVADLVQARAIGRIVIIDDEPYDAWDLYECDGCGILVIDPDSLDSFGLCWECSQEAGAWDRHCQAERASHRQPPWT